MSGQPFTFPPPPTPPPRRVETYADANFRGRANAQGTFRGRGGQSGGRGRGQNFSRGRGRGRGSYGSNSDARPSFGTNAVSVNNFQPHSAKRNHGAAFNDDALRRSRPVAASAVPSFTADLANLLPPKPTPLTAAQKPVEALKKKNGLGLTPAKYEGSDSEDDAGEESRLADVASAGDLQFSYRGQTAALRTPAEIAAWIAERKRRYPTAEKREAAKKDAEEKKKKWAAEKQAHLESRRQAREQRTKQNEQRHRSDRPQPQSAPKDADNLVAAKLRAEKLRRKAMRAQRDLEAAEAALKDPTADHTVNDVSDDDSIGTVSDSSNLTSEDSSDSDSDDEAAPEQQSSKIEVPSTFVESRQHPMRRKKPCLRFARSGRCHLGDKCPYSHEQPRQQQNRDAQLKEKPQRKGLYQVMVEQEQEAERRKVLSAIIALGKQGLLDEPA